MRGACSSPCLPAGRRWILRSIAARSSLARGRRSAAAAARAARSPAGREAGSSGRPRPALSAGNRAAGCRRRGRHRSAASPCCRSGSPCRPRAPGRRQRFAETTHARPEDHPKQQERLEHAEHHREAQSLGEQARNPVEAMDRLVEDDARSPPGRGPGTDRPPRRSRLVEPLIVEQIRIGDQEVAGPASPRAGRSGTLRSSSPPDRARATAPGAGERRRSALRTSKIPRRPCSAGPCPEGSTVTLRSPSSPSPWTTCSTSGPRSSLTRSSQSGRFFRAGPGAHLGSTSTRRALRVLRLLAQGLQAFRIAAGSGSARISGRPGPTPPAGAWRGSTPRPIETRNDARP